MNVTPAVILNVQRQPAANIITVVDRIKTLLPTLTETLPAAVKVEILTDRTTTIRASVKDVEFSLLLTIALVVAVIFLFLRTLSATIIPSVAVPLSIVGTFGVMYLLGYSLNNLTLMALTISTGFVVDDAIVMTENIARFIEQGESPMAGGAEGSEQIGFTIISLTVSLIAVLIPLLFMGDIIGRLFREFAVTLAVTILISAAVSLTLTPMMAARLLTHTPDDKRRPVLPLVRTGVRSDHPEIQSHARCRPRASDTDDRRLRRTLALTALLFFIVPKGFFPVQDTGVIQAVSVAAQSVSFSEMVNLQNQASRDHQRDPAVESLSSFVGIDQTNTTLNNGRVLINLKPHQQREAAPRKSSVASSRLWRDPRTERLHATGPGHHRGRSREPRAVSVHASKIQASTSCTCGRRDAGEAPAPAGTPRRGQRSTAARPARPARARSDTGSRLGITPASSIRRSTTRTASDKSPRCSRS